MTNPTETHDFIPARSRREYRASRERELYQNPQRETILRNAYARAKRAADSTIARNARRLRVAREQWQRALEEGR